MSLDRDRLARIILAELNDIREWCLADPEKARAKGYPREYPAEIIDDYGMLFIDLTIDGRDGSIVCHEVNGPNAVGSDAITGNSRTRARNEALQAVRRLREFGYLDADGALSRPVAMVHAHQHWQFFRTGGEFYPRVAAFADILEELLPGVEVGAFASTERFGNEQVSVIMGDVPAIARRLELNAGTRLLEIDGRPVVFVGNPNLIPEMIRLGSLAPDCRTSGAFDMRVLHGWRLAGLIHDKARQQPLFENTGIRPLECFSAHSLDETCERTRAMLADGPVVVKPNFTSGGVGVTAIVPDMSDAEIRERLEAIVADCAAKYGDDALDGNLEFQGFEFVPSSTYRMEDGGHLWDLRFGVELEPGKAHVYPVTFRFTPDAFDPGSFHTDRRQWISNVSGRVETLLKSGMDDEVLAEVGMTEAKVEQAMQACVTWAMKAWDCSARDGGKNGSVFEDWVEEADRPFYRPEKFRV